MSSTRRNQKRANRPMRQPSLSRVFAVSIYMYLLVPTVVTHRATSEDSDQSGRMSRLTWVFTRIGFVKSRLKYGVCRLLRLCLLRMNFTISSGSTSLFQNLGVFGDIFRFYSNSNRTLCERRVETLIRRRVLRRLIWVCGVCLCPTRRTLGLHGFTEWIAIRRVFLF